MTYQPRSNTKKRKNNKSNKSNKMSKHNKNREHNEYGDSLQFVSAQNVPHYTPPPRHRQKGGNHNNKYRINNKNNDYDEIIMGPEPINNKRRPSYSEIPGDDDDDDQDQDQDEEEEEEELELEDIICTESTSSSIIYEPIHSDSNPSESAQENVYLHNNRKHNYYYQRKPTLSVSNDTKTVNVNNTNTINTNNKTAEHTQNKNNNNKGNIIDSTQFELDLRGRNNNNNNNNVNNNYSTYTASSSSSRSPALSANNGYVPMQNIYLNNNYPIQQPIYNNNNNMGWYNNNNMNMSNMNMSNMNMSNMNMNTYDMVGYNNNINMNMGYNMNQNMNTYNMNQYCPNPPISPIPMVPQLEQPMDGEYFVSIDVECAATGYGHFDSAPCRIAMVDFYGNILFDKITSVPTMIDPLFEFTGLTKWEIQNKGNPLSIVLSEFHDLLISLNKSYKYGVTIIGQSVIMDIIWTSLHKNIHYNRTIDIAHKFKTQNEKWSKFTYYSLRQVAWGLLDCQMNDKYHDPTEDARVTIQLYRDFCLKENILNSAKKKLKQIKYNNKFPDFKVHTKFPQCSGMYSPNRCLCGQKTAVGIDGIHHIEKLRKLYKEHQRKPVLYQKYI